MTASAVGRVLVTGVNGFVGRHVTAELVAHGHQVVGTGREAEPTPGLMLDDYQPADLTGPWPALPGVDAVVHLAGLSAVGPSFDQPQRYLDVNGGIVNRMAAWATEHAPSARVVVVSSGAVYDATVLGDLDEKSSVALGSPYVVSKLLVENLAAYYRRRGLDWVVARPFNHIGPGQGSGFLLPDLAHQLLAVRGSDRPLSVGDLGTARDYTDVRDVASAYRLLLQAPPGPDWVFNVCSGRPRTGRELLDLLVERLGPADVEVSVDISRLRPDDPGTVSGSAARLRALTGWEPQRSIESCVDDFVRALGGSAAA